MMIENIHYQGFIKKKIKKKNKLQKFLSLKTLLKNYPLLNTLTSNYMYNYDKKILNNLKKFNDLGCEVLSGISRKSMIGNVINKPPEDKLYGSLAATLIAIKNLSTILRVHDVRETKILLNFKNLILD